MSRICENCGFQNKDEYDYCAKCGTPLIEELEAKNFIVIKQENYKISTRAIILSYIVTIFLSWSGFIVGLISKHTHIAMVTFFGFFMPFYLIQSSHPSIKKHGLIQLLISIIGVILSIYVMVR